jgi:hypothetical protein
VVMVITTHLLLAKTFHNAVLGQYCSSGHKVLCCPSEKTYTDCELQFGTLRLFFHVDFTQASGRGVQLVFLVAARQERRL